ncbi:MAG: uroporphyrinogen-III synthase [Acidimicrobiia bacterium]
MPLKGRRVVVTRAQDQASELTMRLSDAGAVVIEVPTIKIVDPADGGAALRAAVARLDEYDWVVVTSANGAARFVQAGGGAQTGTRIAVVGPATADVLGAYGVPVDLVPHRFVAEGLLGAFEPPPERGGRVLVPQAEVARPVLVDGLRAMGWTVDVVVAYRTIPAELPEELIEAAAGADAITFTASSTVANFVNAAGVEAVPSVVVCIGPATAATARERGLDVTAVATTHDLAGLVAAVVDVLS